MLSNWLKDIPGERRFPLEARKAPFRLSRAEIGWQLS
jgi:hypothetical protein